MYDKKMIKIGRVSMGLAIIANFIPAIYVGLRYGEMPGIATILQIWALVAATYGISWIIQPIAYYPTLGAPGSYIGWLAGSDGTKNCRRGIRYPCGGSCCNNRYLLFRICFRGYDYCIYGYWFSGNSYSSCVCNGIVQLYFAGAFRCNICGYCEKRLKNRNLYNRCGYGHYDFRRKNWNPWWCFDTADRTEWYFDYKSLFCKRTEKRGIKLFWIRSESYV